MTAPLDSTGSEIVEVAQAQPRGGQGGQQIVARIPPDCVRTDVRVDVDVSNRYLLPQVPNAGALRKMVQGDDLVVSTRGLGALVLDDFVTAAQSANPPFLVLADGTVLTAQQVLRLPERQIAVEQCQPQQSSDQLAAELAQTAPGAGPQVTPGAAGPAQLAQIAPGAGAGQLAQIAPGAGPGGAGGGGGGDAGGSRFQSNFAPTDFLPLAYNPVQPLAFGRTAPELAPGPARLIGEELPIIPETPATPPGPNDTIITIGPASGSEDFGTAADQSASQGGAAVAIGLPTGPIPLPITVSSADPTETITVTITSGPGVDPAAVRINGQAAGPNGWVFSQAAVAQGLSITQLSTDSDRDLPFNVTVTTVQANPDGSQTTFVSGPTPLTVVVDAYADDPIVTLTGGPATGLEDTPIALPDITTALQDNDGSELVERRIITDLPPGTLILLNGAPLPVIGGQVDVSTLTPAELNNLQVQPPPDFAGTFTLNLRTTVFDVPQDGELTTANNRVTVTTPIPVVVTPVPDTVFFPAPGQGREDGGAVPDQSQNATPPAGAPANGEIPLDFGIVLAPNETLRDVVVDGVPAGAVVLVGGVPLPAAASYTLTAAQVALGVSLLPPADSDANFNLTITPTVSQAGQDFTLPSAPLPITVDAVADDPLFTLAGADALGNAAVTSPEDTLAPLPDAATLGLQDLGETLTLTIDISGAPAGTTLTPPAGATLTPVAGQPGVFQLSGATPAELQSNFNGLQLQPPADFAGVIPIVVRVTATENPAEAGDIAADNTATVAHNITVTVTPVADTTFNPAPASGREDNGTGADQTINAAAPAGSPPNGPIPLAFGITLGPNETLRDVVVGGVPPGSLLQSGGAPLTANPDGTFTLTPAQIAAGITLTPPTDADQNFPLTITPTITQNGTDITLPSAPLQVTIDAVADDPLFTLQGADPAGNAAVTTPEDTAAALPDLASLGLQDGGETLSMTIDISGAPAGTTIVAPPGVTLTPVPGQPGVFQLSGATPAELQANFNTLQIQPPANFSGTIPVVVNVTSTENPAEAGDNPADNTATVTHNITVTVSPLLDTQLAPVVGRGKEDLGPAADQISVPGNGVSDGAIAVPITFANQPANETVDSITVSGVPAGVALGVRNPDSSITPLTVAAGSVTITAAQAANLVVSGLPADSDADFQLNVSAVVSQNGVPFVTPLVSTISVLVDAVADRPTLAGPASATGAEDTVIALTGVSGGFNDADGSETQTITVEFIGAPAGTQLLVNGVARTAGPDGKFTITTAELSQLSIQTAANDATDFTTRITATASENATVDPNAAPDLTPGAPETGERVGADNTALQSIDIQVVVNPTPDTTFNPLPAAGREDGGNAADQTQNAAPPAGAPANGPIPLNFGITLGPGETLTSVVVAGVPTGGVLQVGGVPLAVAPGGSYTLTAAQVALGVSLTPPTDGDANITLTITPTVTQDGQTLTLPSAALPVAVDAVADDPLFTLAGADGQGNAAVTTPEDIAAALPDAATLGLQDSGETLTLTIDISGAPAGTTLTPPAGATLTPVAGQPGVFQLSGASAAELQTSFNGLTLTPPANFSGAIPVVVRVTSTENPAEAGDIAADNTATVEHNITVTVAPAPDTQLAPVVARGKEDLGQAGDQIPAVDANGVASGPISIPVTFANQPANEAVDSVTVSGVPTGVTLGVRNPDNSISPLTVTGGSVTLTAAQAASLVVTGLPADSDADFQLNISAVISQNGVAFAAPLTSTISVLVDAVADRPVLNAPTSVTGAEDTVITLTGLSGSFADSDGSETQSFTVVFVGAPAGTQLFANGVPLVAGPGGVFTVTSAQLSQLSVQSAPNDATDFTVRVTATATENATVDPAAAPDLNPAAPETGERVGADNTASTVRDISVVVNPAPDTQVNPAPAAGREDRGNAADQSQNATPPAGAPPNGAIPLNFGITLGAGETLTGLVIGGLPAGAELQSGGAPLTANPDGTYTLTQAQITAGVTLIPPNDADANVTLTVTATISQDGQSITLPPAALPVTIDAVADDPLFTLAGADGAGNAALTSAEDAIAALPDAATLGLQDSGETLSLTIDISGAPAGTTLTPPAGATLTPVAGQQGVFQLSGANAAELQANFNGVTLTPPANFSGAIPVVVRVTSTENPAEAGDIAADNTATVAHNITVTVTPVRDSTLSADDAALKEDLGAAPGQTPVPQPPSGAQPVTITLTLGPNEVATAITISGVPAGVTFNQGTNNNNGTWSFTPAQLAGLQINALPSNRDTDFDLTVTANVSQNGVALPALTDVLHVTIDAVADAPTLTLSSNAATGAEDTAIALPDITAALADIDASETLALKITGVPAGGVLAINGTPLDAARNLGNGEWSLTGLSQADLNALTLTPPANFSGAIAMSVVATATEAATAAAGVEIQTADNVATTTQNFTLNVTPVRDSTLTAGPTAIKEDLGAAANQNPVPQPPSGAQPVNITLTVGPNEAVTGITISGVPTGVAFNQGTNNNNGTWSFTQAQLAGLTINGLPQNSDSEFTLTVTANVSQNGVALPALTGSILVTVDAVADAPILTLTGTATGAEDTPIALPDIASSLRDTDGSETLALKITGVPAGGVLSINGTPLDAARNLGNGEWSLTGLSQADLNALTFTPPANFNGAIAMSVVATATEGATGAGEIQTADNVATTTQNFTVNVTPTRDSTLTVSPTAIKEDLGAAANQTPVPQPPSGAQPVNITLTLGANETVTGITISGVPTGVTFNQGTNNNNGTWSFTQAQLAGLTINGLPQNSDSEFTLTVTANISQNGVALPALTGNVVVTVDAVADAPVLTLTGAATGAEDTPIALPDIASNLRDTDGSETLALKITGVPAGGVLSINGIALDAARNLGNGEWSLTGLSQADLNALTLTPPANFAGAIAMSVVATATEGASGAGEIQTADNVATTTQNFTVTVTPVRDSTLTVAPTSIKEDLGAAANQTPVPAPPNGAQPVTITLTVGPNETIGAITVSGVPTGVTFNQGTNNNNGTWSFTQAQLTGLTINGLPQNSDAEFTLTVTANVSQNGVALPALTGNVVVTVDAVADAPVLTLTSSTATGNENTAIALPDITSNLRDADGSETFLLVMNISGAPAGSVLGVNGVALDAARNLGGGQWNLTGLTQTQLNGLTITPPNEFGGQFQLSVVATATEGASGAGEIQTADNVATASQNITITVNSLPNGGQASATVSEAGNEATANFNAGSNAASNSEIATGSLNYSFDSDGQAAANPFSWGATVAPTDSETGGALSLTSGGIAVVWSVSADGLTITGARGAGGPVVATLQVTDVATGAFRYEQIGPFDHPDVGQSGAADPINLAFSYTVRDANGDAAAGNLNVTVQDDSPVVVPIVKSANEQFGANTNLLITLDISGSMNDASGVTGLTRLQAAKLAIAELIEQYDALGDVVVRFVLFSTDASSNAGGWLTVDQAMAFLDSLTASGFTNYDAALNTAQTAFGTAGKIAGAQNIGYFLSDGVPNRPTGSEGVSAAEEAAWETFLTNNDIKSYAIGMGTGVTTGPLEPIAYDGIAAVEIPAVAVTDLAQLPAVLVNTVPPSTVTGSILSDPGPIGQFGADNGRVESITINGATYTYNPATDSIVVTGGPNAGAFNATTNVLTVNTALGGRMALDFDDGTYVYTLPTSIAANVSEVFQYRLVDNDGDLSASETITFNLIDVNRGPLVRNDTVVTNVNGSGAAIAAPAWALLVNDTDPDGDPLTATAVSGATDGAVALASGVATFTDNDSDGGTYNYTGGDGTFSNNGHVIVNRAQLNEATLDGTGFGEILIGRTANDTILANEGADVLIGGGGADTLNGGAGDDTILFQGLASNYLGGAGIDSLRVESTGTLDLRAAATDDARIESIDRLSLANASALTVQVDYQGLLDLEADGNSLRITAGSGATTLDLSEALGASGTNTWVKTVDTATIDTYQYTPTGGGPVATLVVDNQINVV